MSATAHIPGDPDSRSWPITIGFALSLLLHAAVVFWFVSVGAALGATEQMRDPELFEPPDSPIVELGEPDSEATTITWIGYTEYEEHLTRQSETEQALAELATTSSAPSMDQGDEQSAADPVVVQPEVTLAEAPEAPALGETERAEPIEEIVTAAEDSTPTPIQEDVITERPLEAPEAEQEIVVASDDEARVEREVGMLPSDTPAEPEPSPTDDASAESPSEAAPPDQPEEPVTPDDVATPAVVVAPPTPGTTRGGQGGEGTTGDGPRQPSAVPSDREAVATAIKDSAEYKPGKPLASKGLRVNTVRPDLSHFTALFASYQDPVARIFFARDGHVVDVHLLQKSGHRDVDRNTLDALYRWTAEGELLKQLRRGVVEPGTNRLIRGDDLAVGVFHRLGEETVAVDIQIIVR